MVVMVTFLFFVLGFVAGFVARAFVGFTVRAFAGSMEPKAPPPPRCEVVLRGCCGKRCVLGIGHSGPHLVYLGSREVWFQEGDVAERWDEEQ
jgi:hypothetical protein